MTCYQVIKNSGNSVHQKLRQKSSKVHCFLGGTVLFTHQEDLIGTFAECGVVGAVHWSLAGKLGVELADVIGRLLPKETGHLIILQGLVTGDTAM